MLFQYDIVRSAGRRFRKGLLAGTALIALALGATAHAAPLTWQGGTPGNQDMYIEQQNWVPQSVPGAGDIAIYGNSAFTNLTIELPGLEVDAFQFNAGAPQYSFNIIAGNSINFLGAGIVNNSSFAPLITVNGPPPFLLNSLTFSNNAGAGNATININASGVVSFEGASSAQNATIDNDAGFGGGLGFVGNSTAGDATIITRDLSTTIFIDNSTGGNAHFVIASFGTLSFMFSAGPANDGIVTAGSIEGGGQIMIGGDNTLFRVGGNDRSTTYGGVICDCGIGGTLEKVGTGTLILTGDNTYAGSTIITNGTLQLGGGGTTGSVLAGTPIINNSILSLNRSDTVLLDNDISGTGILNHNGTGTTILLGNNTYTGATNINAGTLQAGIENAFGSNSAVTVANNAILDSGGLDQTLGSLAGGGIVSMGAANLTAGGNNLSSNFSGAIDGTGALIKNGSGVLTLSGNNLYTGATTVNGGGLIVDGSIASSSGLTVGNNAFVGGTGTLPTTTINGGVFAPGNSIGTINVQGNLTFGAGSVYQVEVDPTDADRTNVTGTATLAGTVQAIPLPGSFRARTYTILNATGGVTGTFSSLITVGTFGPGARNPHLTYDVNNVFLVLEAGTISPLLPAVAPRNSQAVATALDGAVLAGATPPAAFDALFNFSGQGLAAALTQLDGEVATGMQQAGFKALDLFLGAMLNPFLHGRGETAGGGPALAFAPQASSLPRDAQAAYAAAMPVKAPPLAPASFGQRWSVWGSAYGGTSNTDGDAAIGSQDTRTNAYGFAAGVDHRLTPDTLTGFALAGGGTSWSLAGSLGSGRSDMFQAGIYGSHRFAGSAYISAAAAYTWHDASTNRNLTLAGVGQLDADFDAHSFGGRIEGGYRWLTPFAGLTPYGALQVTSIRTPGYLETGLVGAAPFALAYNSRTTTATRTELGLWFDRSLLLNPDAALTLRARAAWAHDFNDDRDIAATFQTVPLASFTVFGASPAQDYALLSGAAELRLRNGWSFALKGDAELAARTQTFSGNGTLRYAW